MTVLNTQLGEGLRALARSDLPSLNAMFAANSNRAKSMTTQACGLYVDYAKQRMTPEILSTLIDIADAAGVLKSREDFFAGKPLNTTENRAVLHPALRGSCDDVTINMQVAEMCSRTRSFAENICASGKYKAVVHIGIGGSDLGPRLLADGFAVTGQPLLDIRFANNVDGASINDALADLDPRSTLVVIVSKSFTTQETAMNGKAAKIWLGEHAGDNLIAVSTNKSGAVAFGVKETQIFEFWDWVGGRFSLWSAVGLSLQLAYGPDTFDELLAGAAEMDAHFQDAPLAQNLPVILALIDIWNGNYLGYGSRAVVPYARRLRKLPSFLQQLEMESNGKSVTKNGNASASTCSVVWGSEGTNAQHAYFQQLHQGTLITPVDFIAVLADHENRPDHHAALLANCFAQSEALMQGKPETQVRKDLEAREMSADDIDALAPHKVFAGNRPSTTIALEKLDARTLGALIALFEHKVFVAGVIWDINAFDQWGVELGKELAGTILGELQGRHQGRHKDGHQDKSTKHDSSTSALIALARAHNSS